MPCLYRVKGLFERRSNIIRKVTRCRKGESVNTYLVDLNYLAETCDFDEFLSQAFQDRLVCGLVSSDMRKRILTENDLTLSRAIEITTRMEAAEFEAINIKNGVASKIHKFTKANAIPENNVCQQDGKKPH
ncbi:hypothetical protein QYM36_019199 [Artemia franciscana]|uniref:Retrotransposon gag domain-containing protein n=1 Tax=Artemia franciscana TaxID=6661 RepID=A0AA88H885_ARTSF|nr:hypothetical protein QYM36_019199 [Artemia franciscana]